LRLVLASGNPDKVREIKEILRDIEVLPLSSFVDEFEIEESGLTFRENAYIKVQKAFELTGLPSLADDTGLVVHGLHGMPGVFSSRFAGENAGYEANRRKLLEALRGMPLSARRAYFICVVAFMEKPGEVRFFEGKVEGFITKEPRGDGGFGYDPIFLYPPLGRTFAELSLREKNRVSHRYRALSRFREYLNESGLSR